MMVCVTANIIEIIVLPSSTNALLSICSTTNGFNLAHRGVGSTGANKYALELGHSRIREEQCWIIRRDYRRRRNIFVATLFEEFNKCAAHLPCRPFPHGTNPK
jgi:hypothetical protein